MMSTTARRPQSARLLSQRIFAVVQARIAARVLRLPPNRAVLPRRADGSLVK